MADFQSTLPATDSSDGSVAPGTPGTEASLIAGIYNGVSTPTPSAGQQVAVQLDANSRLITRYLTSATDTVTTVGNVSSLSADSGDPVKIGAVYNSVLPNPSSGERVDAQADSFGRLIVANVNKYSHLTGAATTTVKSGAGYLHTICCNNATASSVITIYDSLTASGTIIAVITMATGSSAQAFTQIFDIAFTTGLTIVRTVNGTDITVSYQ